MKPSKQSTIRQPQQESRIKKKVEKESKGKGGTNGKYSLSANNRMGGSLGFSAEYSGRLTEQYAGLISYIRHQSSGNSSVDLGGHLPSTVAHTWNRFNRLSGSGTSSQGQGVTKGDCSLPMNLLGTYSSEVRTLLSISEDGLLRLYEFASHPRPISSLRTFWTHLPFPVSQPRRMSYK